MSSPSEAACPSCHAPASGKFCSNCGAPLPGATCGECGASLTPGAKFCHRCGSPAQAGVTRTEQRGFAKNMPWAVAGIALVALVALVAGQRFSQRSTESPAADTPAGATASGQPGGPPDLGQITPTEAAVRLFNRVMGAHERGQQDTVRIFAPMAIAAYQMIGNLDLDQRYDLGRVAAVSGDEPMAHAQADTILARNPTHLLGLILAVNAARMRRDTVAERDYQRRLVAAAPAERQKQLPEYVTHDNDISLALNQARRP